VAGLVLGFALRSAILDVFTGLAVHIDRSYEIGDWIEVHGGGFAQPVRGEVIQVNWRTTRLRTTARNVIVIPNGVLGTTPIVNLSLPTNTSRFKLAITLDAAVPPGRATRVLLAGVTAAMGRDGLLEDPDPKVLVDDIAAEGVRYEVRYYQDCSRLAPMKGKDRVLRSLLEHLDRAGISPAYPKQDVFHAPMPERNLSLKSAADRVGLLARIDLFDETLQLRELEELAREMPLRQYGAGEILLREGDAGASMFVLSEGLLGASVRDRWGESVQVARIAPGQAFGEMSLFTGEPRSATVTALTDVVAFEISKTQFQALLARRPAIAEHVAGLVAQRRVSAKQAREGASAEAQTVDARTLSQQILGRIRSFFGFEGD
jgi:CRP-like cAMP-binding protein